MTPFVMTDIHPPDRVPDTGTPLQGRRSFSLAAARPPERLCIYYLHGRVQPELFADADCLGIWEEGEVSFVFFSGPALERVQARIEDRPELSLVDHYQMSYTEWQGGRLSSFCIGPLTVRPVWEHDGQEPGQEQILLDPGVVFGSGLHPTTRDCLRALTRLSAEQRGKTVLDIGTGSGLLAIAAVRLGWDRVLACDLNPLAVQTAVRNVCFNQVQDRVLPFVGQADHCPCHAMDLIVANIHFDVMRVLMDRPDFSACRAFILSGLLPSQMAVIAEMLKERGRTVQGVLSEDGTWQTCLGC